MRNILRPIVLLLFSLWNYTLSAQSSINGIITIQNSFYSNQVKIDYVQNAQVEGILVRAKPTITDANGAFKLLIINAKANEKIRLKIIKEGYQVVNQNRLNALTDQADTVRIFMAKPEDIEAARLSYFNTSKTLSEAAFKKKLNALSNELTLLRSKSNVDENRILMLENSFKNVNKNAKKLEEIAHKIAINYSLINLDEASLDGQIAFNYFQKNDVDSALIVLKNADLIKKLDFLEKEKKDRIRKQIKENDPKIEGQLQRIWADYALQADFYQIIWETEQADSLYQLMLKHDSTNVSIYKKYGVFLVEINQLNRAKNAFEKALNYAQLSTDKIELMDQLGQLYAALNEVNKAEKILNQATDMAEWEIINRKDVFEPLYALTQLHLGQVLTQKKDFDNAEYAFKMALKFHQEYATKSPAKPKDSLLLATTFNSMAINFLKQNNYEKSLNYFDKTNAIFNKILDSISLYKTELMAIKNNYAQLFLNQKDTLNAIKFFSEELDIYKALIQHNNTAFAADYLTRLNYLSGIYIHSKNHKNALPILDTIAAEQKRLVLAHPQQYEGDYEKTLNTLATIYWEQKNYILADTCFKKAVELHKIILKGTPQYRPEICRFHNRFGAFYKEQKMTESAECQYVKSVELRRDLVDKEPLVYGEIHQINLQTIIDLHDTLLLKEIFENKIKVHKDIQNNCRNEMVELQNKIITALEKSTIKDKQGKLNEAYGNLAGYYLSLNKIKEAELVAKKQEINNAHFLIFIYSIQDKFNEAQLVLAKIGDKKAAKTRCLQWANDFYNQRIISWAIKTKINKWLETSTTIGLLGN
jgi:tetratricopeptide (TPR) repeat protein